MAAGALKPHPEFLGAKGVHAATCLHGRGPVIGSLRPWPKAVARLPCDINCPRLSWPRGLPLGWALTPEKPASEASAFYYHHLASPTAFRVILFSVSHR